MQTWEMPVGSEMCGGESDRVTGCADRHRDKTTLLRETSWRFGGISFGTHTRTQTHSVALLNEFIAHLTKKAQGS